MDKWKILVLMLTLALESSEARSDSKLCFPKDFKWGVATASYQIEGAWNKDGKGESIWDHYTHSHPDRVFDHTNGDVADDSYRLFREDVRLIKQLGVHFYRFSISWPRILPRGFSNEINQKGVQYYTELIDELLANGIEPLVTMYHWDLPQTLQDLGGWTNPIMADYFVDYARVLMKTYSHKVKTWITFNEPLTFCHEGYGGDQAPGHYSSGVQDYMCGHNVLRAHGLTYRMVREEFTNTTGGDIGIGITLDTDWVEPESTKEVDEVAAETARQFFFGWFAHPIFSETGDYPPIMRTRIDEMSKQQHYPRSRLPTFTKEEITYIHGSADFLGLNHYTTLMAKGKGKQNGEEAVGGPDYYSDIGVGLYRKGEWPATNSTWLRVVPWGFGKLVNWIKKSYNNPLVIITENGVSTHPGLNDTGRVSYIDSYLRSLHTAVTVDNCNVVGYTHWSLMDNFEWTRGYSERFGLYEVDYKSPDRTRTPRASASVYSTIAHTGCLPSSKYMRLRLLNLTV